MIRHAAIAALAAVALVPSATRADDVQTLARGNGAFAIDLYKELAAEEARTAKPFEGGAQPPSSSEGSRGNLFFSPHSISTALAMTYAGARAKTAEEMARALRFDLPPEKLHAAFEAELKALGADPKTRGYELSVANALWGQKGYGFLDDFLKLTKARYGAGLEELDFKSDAEGARKRINGWVEDKTHEKIKDLIQPGVLDARTRLVLTNAIYFKGSWLNKFDAKESQEGDFACAGGKSARVTFMHKDVVEKDKIRYGETSEVKVLEIPYTGDGASMVIVLPKKEVALDYVEKSLSPEWLAAALASLSTYEHELDVRLPRFKLTKRFELAPALGALGIKDLFDSGAADLSGMKPLTTDRLYVSNVIHKAFVDVNEEGTEAAAATGVVIKAASAVGEPKTFHADKPFVFMIRDKKSGEVLFMGRVADPTVKE